MSAVVHQGYRRNLAESSTKMAAGQTCRAGYATHDMRCVRGCLRVAQEWAVPAAARTTSFSRHSGQGATLAR